KEESLNMKTIFILIGMLLAVSFAAAYTPEQQVAIDGARLSFQLGMAFEKANQGQDIPAFNSLVDQWNAWVANNFGNDTTLLMKKMTVPADSQKPYLSSNNSTANGIVHEMDSVAQYTTNDVNLMSGQAIDKYANSSQGTATGSEYLGGV
ncbi:MAG TPA: hypothetical protein PKL29_05910, partial [Methanothrix sp.]|nr:hypothetical protein [Methanothrix sp.]